MQPIDSLVLLATEMGLDPVHVREALETQQYKGVVAERSVGERRLDVTCVAFFVIDRRPDGCLPASI